MKLFLKIFKKTSGLLKFSISTAFFYIRSLKVKTIFFFPSYHTGGAERVHLDIVQSLPHKKSIVIFTGKSYNSHFLNDFKKAGYIFDISAILGNPFYKRILYFVFSKIGIFNQLTTFGCNTTFYYDLLPLLRKDIKKIDLLHAFTFPEKTGMENYSINRILLLNKRIVINQKTKQDYIDLYKKNNIPIKFVDRINIIYNAVPIPEKYTKKNNDTLNVIYCGRIAKEKRVNLFVDIAEKNNKHCNFYIYGEQSEGIKINKMEKYYIKNVTQEQELNDIYQHSDILLITSYREGFPMVIMEAMSAGVVCISTNVGGISEHINESKNGFLIDNQQTDEDIIKDFSEKISLLDKNREFLHDVSKNAYLYAKQHFSQHEFRNKYRNILR